MAFRSERPEGLRLVQGHNPTPTQVKTPLLVGSRAARSGTQGPELKATRTTTPGQTVFQDGPISEADRKTPTGCYFLTEAYCRLVVDEGIGRLRDSSLGSQAAFSQLRKAEEFPAPAAQSPVRRRVGGAGP